ncbi:uncharacterized protein MYU51_015169 [Penicillium brevicompactum]|uniref:uncharacterized protein n=1 Tax=Penicillium brevicompactum TaxID=5074 RepID=UPI002541E378|nr:uncharacterized protein N7506_001609 [Penicillium brevicompactum]KAJ5348356.1 hypothetical protein N7506_001609 [Penicillium brevicompactum]
MTSPSEPRRPVRVANCSGYHGDPAYEMYRQATRGQVDFITGDYLAGTFVGPQFLVQPQTNPNEEVNMANNAQAFQQGLHPGYEETAWEGIQQTIDVIADKGIKVVINGGALNPKGLALKVDDLARQKGLSLRVAYLAGDDLYPKFGPDMPVSAAELQHLDAGNGLVKPGPLTYAFATGKTVPMVSAHAYLGARGIVDGLRRGADIIICGRVADASPVIAAAWFWHSWGEGDYDRLAGSLIAGHLIECSAYVTGGNFAGFDRCPIDALVEPGFPIAEIEADGSCVITKHEGTGGLVDVDTVRCQFLYELQGNVYLNSDVSAILDDVVVEQVGKDRVRVHGIRGYAPPPTTKLAVFYPGGFESQLLLNATGYATSQKWDLIEKQLRHFIPDEALARIDTLEFQRIGVPAANPISQQQSTSYLRIYVAASEADAVLAVARAMRDVSLKHFSGFHSSLDMRTAVPRPILAYYPALVKQEDLNEEINFIDGPDSIISFPTGHPTRYEPLQPRESYDYNSPEQGSLHSTTKSIRLGDIALARSGDKGANLNFGLFVNNPKHWSWLRAYMSRQRVRDMMVNDDDWDESFLVERVEFPHIHAVHFVIYGILGRGVSSSSRLDGFGKGFADYLRDKLVEVPVEIL